MRKVELAWRRFVPDIELEDAIRAVEHEQSPDVHPNFSDWAHQATPAAVEAGQVAERGDEASASTPDPESQIEPEQGDAEALNWDETEELATAADGIGSLSVSSKGIGYMGPQSGNALLRNLQSASMLYFSPYDDLTPEHVSRTEIPEHILKSSSFTNQCVDWYFRYYHTAYPILHEGCFRAQLMGKHNA